MTRRWLACLAVYAGLWAAARFSSIYDAGMDPLRPAACLLLLALALFRLLAVCLAPAALLRVCRRLPG